MIVVFVASVAVATNRFKVPPLLPTLMDELSVDMVTGGWLMSVSSLAGVLLAVPGAFLIARLGLKAAGLLALAFVIGGSIAGALATSAAVLLAGRVLEGVSVALIAVVAPTAINQWFEPRDRGLPMGIWAAWVPVGNVIAFNSAHPLMEVAGWRSVWWAGALLAFVALLLTALVVRSPDQPVAEGGIPQVSAGALLQMMGTPSAWLLGLTFGAFGFCLIGFNTWAPTYLTAVLGIEPAAANGYASLMFLAAIPANLLAGWLMGVLMRRHLLLPASFVATGLLFFWGFRLGGTASVVPYMLALGFASNLIPSVVFVLTPETMPNVAYAGLAMGILMTLSHLGALTGPPALGAVLRAGSWAAGGFWLAAVMAFGTGLAWLVSRRARQQPGRPGVS